MEAELALHSYSYVYGIKKASTRDADLEYDKDSRWYVMFLTSLLQVLGV